MNARKICIVDDDPSARDALLMTLVDAGYVVNAAETIGGGLALAHSQRHDVIIVDLQLPGVGDCAIVARFRRTFPGTPIVALSGNEALGPVALALGAVAFLNKPAKASDITDCIERVCESTLAAHQKRS